LQVPRSDLFWEGCEWNVGRYQLGEVIGRGTYGTVHACLDLDTGKDLAVKVVPKHHTGENTGVEKSLCAVENEVRVLSCLKNCPSLVRLVDFFQVGAHMVSAWASSQPLPSRAVLLPGSFPLGPLLFADQVCKRIGSFFFSLPGQRQRVCRPRARPGPFSAV